MSEPVGWRIWGGDRCNHCCNGDRCEDSTHVERNKCTYCKGTGVAIWLSTNVAWNGEGLPPVGTVCEFKKFGRDSEWTEVEIIAHFRNNAPVAAFIQTWDGHKTVNQAIAECFRPIRTPEQIAAEERERVVMELKHVIAPYLNNVHTCAYALYDCGYRKRVQP